MSIGVAPVHDGPRPCVSLSTSTSFLPRREIQKPCLKIHDGRTEASTADRPDEHVYHPTEGRVTKPQTPDRGNLLDRNKACSVWHALVGTAGEHKMLKDTLHTRRVLREPDAPPTKRAGTSRPRLPSSSTAGKLYSKRTIKLAVLVPLDEGPTTNKEASTPEGSEALRYVSASMSMYTVITRTTGKQSDKMTKSKKTSLELDHHNETATNLPVWQVPPISYHGVSCKVG